jgi:hypothetical protein
MIEVETKYKNMGALFAFAGGISFISGVLSGCKKTPIIVSNVLVVIGMVLVLRENFLKFVLKKNKIPGCVVFSIGFVLILANRNVLGTLIEIVGTGILFRGFIPRFITTLRKVPYVGQYFRFSIPSWMYQNNEELPL